MPEHCPCVECVAAEASVCPATAEPDADDTPLADRLHAHADELARLERTVGTDAIEVTLHGAGAMHVDLTYPGLKTDE